MEIIKTFIIMNSLTISASCVGNVWESSSCSERQCSVSCFRQLSLPSKLCARTDNNIERASYEEIESVDSSSKKSTDLSLSLKPSLHKIIMTPLNVASRLLLNLNSFLFIDLIWMLNFQKMPTKILSSI